MHKKLLLLSFILPIFMGCSPILPGETPRDTTRTSLATPNVVQATVKLLPVKQLPVASSTEPSEQHPVQIPQQTITIIYTSDEHGWMEGTEDGPGAANLVSVWQDDLGYIPGGTFLVLSGGDMWTGPAISTWFQDKV